MNANNNKLISIEGNIGSGKSTLLAELQEIYSTNPKIVFLKEPVDDWSEIRDVNGITMLEKFYANQERYSFPFQMMAFISRLSVLKKAMSEHKGCIIITERSLYTDKCVFAKMLHDNNHIEDVNYQIYLKWFDEFSKDFPVDQVVYVRANPEICHQRIQTRSRTGESTISLDYLQECHNYHDAFITQLKCNVVSLDGNANIFEKENVLKTWIQLVNRIIVTNIHEGIIVPHISSDLF
uniref:Deoxynucleoside kinase domain-containing protein n=1 Tax=viral metagenome TaxID=1070528 RepID=A0A6C0E310_9ZZZZ